MKYSTELLDQTTKLVSIIQDQLDCSFDEAINVAKLVFRKVKNNEVEINDLTALLPNFLEQVKNT